MQSQPKDFVELGDSFLWASYSMTDSAIIFVDFVIVTTLMSNVSEEVRQSARVVKLMSVLKLTGKVLSPQKWISS